MYDSEFYKNLRKPSFTPKGNVFKIAWGILYFLMLVSVFLVIISSSTLKASALWVFLIQLLLNFVWSPLFFYYQRIKLALLVSILMTLSVLAMIILFYQVSKLAGLLQIPYLLWLCFAGILNYSFIKLNPEVDVEPENF